jgi:hypothetical protein
MRVATTRRGSWRRTAAGTLALALAVAAAGYYPRADSAAELHARDAPGGAGQGGSSTEDTGPVTSGPGVSRPGILLRVRPAPEGVLEVVETVRLRRPVDLIRLRAPQVDRAGADLTDLAPVATSVELSLAESAAQVPEEIGGDPTQVFLPAGTTAYTVRYLLEGSTVPDDRAGRALIAVGPLSAAGPAGRVNLVASGESVLTLSCPLLDDDATACGTPGDDGLRLQAPLPGRSAVVVIEVEAQEP